jgi:hypothetical protein
MALHHPPGPLTPYFGISLITEIYRAGPRPSLAELGPRTHIRGSSIVLGDISLFGPLGSPLLLNSHLSS